MKNRKTPQDIPETKPVKLKPLFGVKPGVYLSVIYGLALLMLLFFLLIFPGLKKNGARVEFDTQPMGAAIFVDQRYVGSSPTEVFIEKGTHDIRVEKEAFRTLETDLRVPGRIVGSLIFPKRLEKKYELELHGLAEYLQSQYLRISDWALVGDFYDRYRYPELMRRSLEALEGFEAAEDSDLYYFLYMLTNNISEAELLADFNRALELALGREYEPNATEASDMAEHIATLLNESSSSTNFNRDLYMLTWSLLFEEDPADTELYDRLQQRIDTLDFRRYYNRDEVRSDELEVRGHRFVHVPAPSSAPVGNEDISIAEVSRVEELNTLPHMEKIGPFYLASTEVTRGQFSDFIRENPRWGPGNKKQLTDSGLVDEQYLDFMDQGNVETMLRGNNLPVSHVSWYAAQAYCRWLTEQLPLELRELYQVRLPSEAQWEFAARMNGETPLISADRGYNGAQAASSHREGALGLVDLQGNLWEWQHNWYFPTDLIDGAYGLADSPERFDLEGREKALRGGSWVQNQDQVPVWQRAGHPPHWSSPFVGFRPALVPLESIEEQEG